MRHHPIARREFLFRQITRRGDEILEGVGFLFPLAFQVPPIAFVLASPHMRDRAHESPVGERQPMRVEARRYGDAVRAVAVEPARRGAVEPRILAIEQRHRHALSVVPRREDAPRRIEGGIVARGYFLVLSQHPFARAHVVVVNLHRRRHRGIAEPHEVGVVFKRPAHAQRIGLLVELDVMLFARRHVPHHDAGQSVFAFKSNEMPLVCLDVEDQPALHMRHQIAPVLAAWR